MAYERLIYKAICTLSCETLFPASLFSKFDEKETISQDHKIIFNSFKKVGWEGRGKGEKGAL